MPHMHRNRYLCAGLAIVAILAGCDNKRNDQTVADLPAGSDSSHQGASMVRVVNAVPSPTALTVATDDANTFASVTFKTVTPFQPIRDNLVTFKLRPGDASVSDTTKPLAENHEMMSDGDRYTVVVLPAPADDNDEGPKLRVLEEPRDAGSPGMARLRFVNAARGVKSFDVFAPGSTDAFFDNVDFGSEAGYKDFGATSAVLQVRADNGSAVLLKLPQRSFEAGKTYTIIITNKSAVGRQLEAITIEDDPMAANSAGGMGGRM
ncbi:MAG: DUF4397 domain-containing protein [Gemmatimonadota bacterium]